ncbi:MAG: ABC transporter ATP-binding protein, partial [Chloroflexi bacterium]|nr:ABC transporter ATP-binding protein [Chloroflexota bacterium]
MLRLAKHLRPFIPLLALAMVLLFAQAMADLALPDYMSDIVNNGIQQGGVASAVPNAIRQSRMDRLTLFLEAADEAQVLAAYSLVDKSSFDNAKLVKQYPALAEQSIYVLTATGKGRTDELSPAMGKALLSVAAIEQAMADPSGAAALGPIAGVDLTKLPAGTDLFAMLARLPDAQKDTILASIDQRFAGMGDSLIVQSAASVVRAEYAALGVDPDKLQTDYIRRTGLLMLGLSLASAACAVAVGYLSARTAAGLARNLRKSVFRKVESFSSAEFDQISTASLITRSTNDIMQIQMVVIMLVRMVIYAPIIGVGGVIRALSKDTSMWWIIAAAVAVLLGLVAVAFSVALPRFRIIQNLIDRLNLVTRENLSGMMVIRAFNRQDAEKARFDKANKDVTSIMLFVNRLMVVMMPAMMMIMNLMMLAIIWVGSHQVADLNMQVGDMMAFMQ